jgi:hypothetical protein
MRKAKRKTLGACAGGQPVSCDYPGNQLGLAIHKTLGLGGNG